MIRNLTDAARAVGALLAAPFALDRCSATFDPAAPRPLQLPHVLVCGTFVNDAEAAKLQQGEAAAATLRTMLRHWQFVVFGRPIAGLQEVCPPLGAVATSMVFSEVNGLVTASDEPRCSSS
ncbi:hypothetical protein PLESTM_000980100 [Pleodorina starrii]|nr:hypothetical protein PLESTM_000980100 [Pleodorina starrii]